MNENLSLTHEELLICERLRSLRMSVQTATFRGQQGRISRPVKAILSGRL